MGKFDAATAVEALEYDFTAYGGSKGQIQEPSTGAVNAFFNNMKAMFKEVKGLQALANVDVEELDEGQMGDLVGKMEDVGDISSKFQEHSTGALAELCGATWVPDEDAEDPKEQGHYEGGSPTHEDLKKLPFRVNQAFTQWLMAEIRPKKTTPALPR